MVVLYSHDTLMHVQQLRREAAEQWRESDQSLIGDEDRPIVVAVKASHFFPHAQRVFEPQTVDAAKSVQMPIRSDEAEAWEDLPFEDFFVPWFFLAPGQGTAEILRVDGRHHDAVDPIRPRTDDHFLCTKVFPPSA